MTADSGGAARAAAATAVCRVVAEGRNLDQALAAEPGGDERTRAQAQALAYGTLRWHCRHLAILSRLLDRPLRRRDRIVEALLSVGLFELLAGRQPEYASVSAAVAAARMLGQPRAAGLVNAVLRRFLRERDVLLTEISDDEEARYAHPRWLIEALRADWPGHWTAILAAAQAQPPMWLRARGPARAYLAELEAAGIGAALAPGFPDAVRLDRAMSVTALPGFDAGRVSVQDAASQLAARLLGPEDGMRVLDACAAPGGKTTHLLERSLAGLDLVAIDSDSRRLDRLRENLRRLALAAEVVAGDALQPSTWWDGRLFDRILLDAPCSASGVMRRHPDIRFLRRPGDIPVLAAQQGRLLDALWPLVAPGGQLLYATCSVLREENDRVVERFRGRTPDAGLISRWPLAEPVPGLVDQGCGWQLLPGGADTDGFYYALMPKSPG